MCWIFNNRPQFYKEIYTLKLPWVFHMRKYKWQFSVLHCLNIQGHLVLSQMGYCLTFWLLSSFLEKIFFTRFIFFFTSIFFSPVSTLLNKIFDGFAYIMQKYLRTAHGHTVSAVNDVVSTCTTIYVSCVISRTLCLFWSVSFSCVFKCIQEQVNIKALKLCH